MSGGRVPCVPKASMSEGGSQHGSSDKTETGKFLESKIVAAKGKSRQAAANTVSHATPFKATGHKDGISRQGN